MNIVTTSGLVLVGIHVGVVVRVVDGKLRFVRTWRSSGGRSRR